MPSLTVNDLSLHYRFAGSGRPAFVLVHGGCCAGSDWDAQLAALAGQFSVLVPDLRCFADAGETSPYLQHLREQVARLAIEILPETGHFSMMERTQTVTGLARSFGIDATI